MVRERSPTKTSSGQYFSPQKSPQKTERLPLANISAKMQSPSPKQPQDGEGDAQLKQTTQLEFGKASPLRNPLKKQEPRIFIPKQKPVQKPSPKEPVYPSLGLQSTQQPQKPSHTNSMSSSESPHSYQQAQAPAGSLPPGFYLPGQQRAGATAPSYPSALAAAQAYTSQPYQRSFEPDVYEIAKPTNAPLLTIQPRPQPTFSSIGPNTWYQPYIPSKPVVDLTTNAGGDEDGFDPDAEIRADSDRFGAADPYQYIDSSQANENIKNLLEGAFDDEDDKSKTRLRKRAKKALNEGKEKEAKGLAAKLAELDVEEKHEQERTEENAEEEEEEDGTVEGLKVKLLPHQVEGVAWMIDKEIGMRKRSGVLPHGGILADDMGLGKTVQSIALMLTNPRPGQDAKPEHKNQKLPSKEVGKGTLVVAPLALMKQWEDEIKTKVAKSHALRVLIHHGSSRTKSAEQLKKYDVVITTYQTLTSEHAGSDLSRTNGARIGCFGVHWYRIILDEAHSIKNRNAKSTLAACALNSWYRWCLTGTPMQNNLDELQSLIKFLRIKPYCELPNWKDAISMPMKNGRGGIAMKRLQYFLKAFMKRRTKDILKKEGALNFGGKVVRDSEADGEVKPQNGMKIVKREIVTMECDFDEAELEFYLRLQNRADQRLKQLAQERGGKTDYIGALVLLLRLRQACNHPQLVEMAINKDKDAITTGTSSNGGSGTQTPKGPNKAGDDEMDNLAALMGGVSVETKHCDICQVELSAAEAKEGAVRCSECNADLRAIKKSGMTSKGKKVKKEKKAKPMQRRVRNRRVVDDSDEDDDGEDKGEWIADGSEQDINLGKAGGTDDEGAEGGGESLGSIDSERSTDEEDDDEDSPPRARQRRRLVEMKSDEEDEDNEREEDSDSGSEAPAPIIRGMELSGQSLDKPSTKIRRLLRILHAEMPKHKTIVFSQFTSMLDLIEPHLKSSNLRYVRYDGSMRPDAREASLHSLRHDPKCRILLCSLKCGSLGLNLTAASRVVIVEPFWNPFVEEQAIDRVHRLNQTVDVKVYRLTVRRTVEERIIELQERKRELAAAAIEGGKGVAKLSMQDIISLFKHDAVQNAHHEEDRELWEKFGGDHRLLDRANAGYEQVHGFAERNRKLGTGMKPGKERLFKEHDVYGRRW